MTQTKFNTSRDWASLARDEKHRSPGQVYIGVGDSRNPLSEIFGGNVNDGDYVNCMTGDTSSLNYFVEIDRWEKYTGLNHAETIGKKVIEKTEEKTMATTHDTSRDWAALASKGAEKSVPAGKVYIGNGNEEFHLSKIFGGECLNAYISGYLYSNLRGDSASLDYFIDIDRWEQYTGLKYSDVATTKEEAEKATDSIHTPYTSALNALVKEILDNKIVDYLYETEQKDFIFYNAPQGFVSDAGVEAKDITPDSKEVSMLEFLTALTALPDRPKSIRFSVTSSSDEEDDGEYDVIVEAGRICVGCHKFTLEEFAKIEAAVQQVTDGVRIPFRGRRTVTVSRGGIEAGDDRFSFEEFNKVKNALNTLKEEQK